MPLRFASQLCRCNQAPGHRRQVESLTVGAGNRVKEQRRIAHVLGERPDLIERGGERHQSEARDAAVGGLQSHNAAVSAAGWRTEPPVSLPSAAIASSAATAAAEPPLDPPGTRVRSHGLPRRLHTLEFSVEEPIANSSRFVRPKGIAPAARSCRITVAS